MHILITGATDGIGLELARAYHAHGARLILVGRRSIETLDPQIFRVHAYCRTDLAQPAAAAIIAAFVRSRGVPQIDRLILNAGIGSYGTVAEQTPAELDALLAVNLYAPIAITHALLPLVERTRGRVVLIGSVAAALPVPHYAVYGATKAGLEGFARNLRAELGKRVGVQIIHPGATRTGIHARSGMPIKPATWQGFPPPDRVATAIMQAAESGTPQATIGRGNQVLRMIGRWTPLADWAARLRLHRLRPIPPTAQPHAVITGAAAGIGRALAEHYAAAGYTITSIDRDEVGWDASGAVVSLKADLADPHTLEHLIPALRIRPPINLLIHSAGINAVGAFADSDLAEQRQVLDVNLRAPMHLTAALLRERRIAAGGSIVFLASLSVFTGYPGASVYAAGKDALAAYARSLRAGLADQQINVLTVFPGPTRTAHARRYSPDNRREARRMPPEHLAALIAEAVQQRRPVLIPGFSNRLVALLGRLVPAFTEFVLRKTILDKLR